MISPCFLPILRGSEILTLGLAYIGGKGGISLENRVGLYLACILAGYALIKVPLSATFLSSLSEIVVIIGVLTMLVFSFMLVFHGVKSLFGK